MNSYTQNVGDPAPDFTVKSLDDEEFTLSGHKGNVIFIFLFGNTCPFCIAAGPETESEIYEQFMDNDNFIAIGIDLWNGSKSSVENFKSQTGISYPLYLNAGSVGDAYNSTYDRAIVIDQDGIISHKGATSVSNDISNVKETISALLENDQVTDLKKPESDNHSLSAVYPNPARDEIFIDLVLEQSEDVSLEIYDHTGRILLRQLKKTKTPKGMYTFHLNVQDLDEGIFIYRIITGNANESSHFIIKR